MDRYSFKALPLLSPTESAKPNLVERETCVVCYLCILFLNKYVGVPKALYISSLNVWNKDICGILDMSSQNELVFYFA